MEKLPNDVKRKVIVKRESETDLNLGKYPKDRSVEELIEFGIINVNKPSGPSSHQVSDHVKKILKVKKAGHSGTLDPLVTGVLPVALEKATRITNVLLKSGKEYVGVMHLHKEVDDKELNKVVKEFIGEVKQLPPVRSAVKRVRRKRNIYYFKILEKEGRDVLFKVGCQAGTYVRRICDDIGKKLGVGAHMSELIRTKVSGFTEENWCSLQELSDAFVLYENGEEKEIRRLIFNVEKGVELLPKVWLVDGAIDSVCHGANLNIPGVSKLDEFNEGEVVALMSLKDELVGLGESKVNSDVIVEKEKGIAVKVKKVFMERKTYKV
jgi:H/ACA ribonucleoprotein complex subunit 4